MSKSLLSGFMRRWFGNTGEKAAEKFLRKKGFRILDRQVGTPWGEIDLIGMDGDTIVFVEVKSRRTTDAREAAEAVDRGKQTRLTRAALHFLKTNGLLEHRARFDVVTVIWPDANKEPEITHFVNAFEAADLGQMF